MSKKQNEIENSHVTLESILTVLQDLFILQALRAGMNVGDIRKHLRIAKWRVSNISKLMKEERSNKK